MLVDIKTAFYTQLKTLVGLPAIRYPDIESSLDPLEEYIVPFVIPNTTQAEGIKETDRELGILQVSIYTRKGKGELYADRFAQIVLDGFKRNSNFDSFRIDETGTINPAFFDGAFKVTPVSIPYYNFC